MNLEASEILGDPDSFRDFDGSMCFSICSGSAEQALATGRAFEEEGGFNKEG